MKLFEKGDREPAANQFVDALLWDPANPIARKNLQVILKMDSFLSKKSANDLSHFLELAEYLSFLEKRLADVKGESQGLSRDLWVAAQQNPAVRENIGLITGTPVPSAAPDVAEIRKQCPPKVAHLSKINALLEARKQALLKELASHETSREQLQALRRQVLPLIGPEQRNGPMGKVYAEMAEKDRVMQEQKSRLTSLNAELEQVRRSFDELKTRIESTDRRVLDLTQKMAGVTLESFEKDKLLADKNGEILAIRQKLTDTEERLMLVQKIIKDKDSRIGELEDQVTSVRTDIDRGTAANDSDVKALQREMAALQEKFREQELRSREKIQGLELSLRSLDAQYGRLAAESADKELRIAALQRDLKQKGREMLSLIGAFESQGEEIGELTGVVEIYRHKLSETHGQLLDRDYQLDLLERQFEDLQERLNKFHERTQSSRAPSPAGTSGDGRAQEWGILSREEILQQIKSGLQDLTADMPESSRRGPSR
ncbi:MAG: hypothetical protein Q8Q08_09725 [Candidatus Omnitrophota bacterium]|nr:hypothetical protein [Candidatus Omnitrophota bacterium]MDZ4242446.1 hypothetical protein [Candidatus Omnitrophota bacterium]